MMACKRLSKIDRECPKARSLAVLLQLSACALQQGYMLLQAAKDQCYHLHKVGQAP